MIYPTGESHGVGACARRPAVPPPAIRGPRRGGEAAAGVWPAPALSILPVRGGHGAGRVSSVTRMQIDTRAIRLSFTFKTLWEPFFNRPQLAFGLSAAHMSRFYLLFIAETYPLMQRPARTDNPPICALRSKRRLSLPKVSHLRWKW